MVQQITSPIINSIILNEEENNRSLNDISNIQPIQPNLKGDNINNIELDKDENNKQLKKNRFLGIIVVCLITITYTISNELSQFLVTSNYNAPFAITWFNTLFFFISFLSEFIIIKYEIYKENKSNNNVGYINQEKETVLKRYLSTFKVEIKNDENGKVIKSGITLKRLFIISLPMSILFVVLYYLWLLGSSLTEVSVSTALYQSATIFCFIFSIIILKEKIRFLKSLSVLIFVGGIIGIGIASFQGNSNNNYPNALTGDILMIVSAALWGLYEVLTAKFLNSGDSKSRTILNTYLGFVALFNLVLGIPIMLIFHKTGYEKFTIPSGHTFGMIFLNAFISFAVNYLLTYALSIVSPLFVRAGELMVVPTTLLFDIIVKHINFNLNAIPGYVLIVIGFILSIYIQHKEIKKQTRLNNINNDNSNDIKNNDIVNNKTNNNSNNNNNIADTINKYTDIII